MILTSAIANARLRGVEKAAVREQDFLDTVALVDEIDEVEGGGTVTEISQMAARV